MSNLNEQQFGGGGRTAETGWRMEPKDKHGNSLYPQDAPDYDSVAAMPVLGREHAEQVVRRKTAKRYDVDTDTYKTARVDRWHLHRPEGTTHYPAGWDGGI